jgi:D-alanyl-D-alanine carboxypeptidase (penicillin-binding protein 5/6)
MITGNGRVHACCRMIAKAIVFLWATASVAAEPIIPSPPQLAASAYLLMDATTGKTLVEHNADQRLPPASLTKLMTSFIAASAIRRGTISPSDEVLISVKAWRMKGSLMFIREGTRVSVADLLRGIIIQSGNDASVAMAEHIAGSEEAFVDVMNQQADRLGMADTHFMNSTGLPDENHYTTARDLSKLTVALIQQFPEHYKMYSEKSFTYNNISQRNRNKLLFRDKTVDGVKTGHTEAAGYCLVSSAVRDDMRLVSVVMGALTEPARAIESQKLLTYGFRYFETATLYAGNESLKRVRVWGGSHNSINLGLNQDIVVTLPRGSRAGLTASTVVDREIHAPLAAGQELGKLTIQLSDDETLSEPLVALNAVDSAGFFSRLWDSISLFFLNLFGGDPLALAE